MHGCCCCSYVCIILCWLFSSSGRPAGTNVCRSRGGGNGRGFEARMESRPSAAEPEIQSTDHAVVDTAPLRGIAHRKLAPGQPQTAAAADQWQEHEQKRQLLEGRRTILDVRVGHARSPQPGTTYPSESFSVLWRKSAARTMQGVCVRSPSSSSSSSSSSSQKTRDEEETLPTVQRPWPTISQPNRAIIAPTTARKNQRMKRLPLRIASRVPTREPSTLHTPIGSA